PLRPRRRPLHARRDRTRAGRKHRRQAALTRSGRARARFRRRCSLRRRLARDPPPRRRMSGPEETTLGPACADPSPPLGRGRGGMTSGIAPDAVGANPCQAAQLAVFGVILVIGLVIFALPRWPKRREGQAEGEPPTHNLSGANEATHVRASSPRPSGRTGETV